MINYMTEEKLLKEGFKKDAGGRYYFKQSLMGIDIVAKCVSCGRWGTKATRAKKDMARVMVNCETCETKTTIDLDKRKLRILAREK